MNLTKIKELLQGNEKADEILKEINAENGKDVQKGKDDLAKANQEKQDLENKIKELEESSKNANDFKTKYESLKNEIDERNAREEKAKVEQGYQDRFAKVLGEKEFRDDLTKNAIFNSFKEELCKEENKGKGDSEILEALTKDTDYWKNPNNNHDGMVGAHGTLDDTREIEENKIREIMGLPPIDED